MNNKLQYYLEQLGIAKLPSFLEKYLKTPSLIRLKKVGYFCGMDYASKDIYPFALHITRFDHSLSVALITYKLTHDKIQTLAGLFHDIATPCFSHVIDYMNKDYENQESTEEYTERILKEDKYLLKCLQEDNIDINQIIDFKKYSIVDNKRPKLCADRIDGVILTGISWTKNITEKDIKEIVDNLCVFTNEDNEPEIGFTDITIARKVVEVSESIDIYCHSNEDNYMMELLANITRQAIKNHYVSYDELYTLNEDELFTLLKNKSDLKELIYEFQNKKMQDIPPTELLNVKIRDLNPLVNNIRIKNIK